MMRSCSFPTTPPPLCESTSLVNGKVVCQEEPSWSEMHDQLQVLLSRSQGNKKIQLRSRISNRLGDHGISYTADSRSYATEVAAAERDCHGLRPSETATPAGFLDSQSLLRYRGPQGFVVDSKKGSPIAEAAAGVGSVRAAVVRPVYVPPPDRIDENLCKVIAVQK